METTTSLQFAKPRGWQVAAELAFADPGQLQTDLFEGRSRRRHTQVITRLNTSRPASSASPVRLMAFHRCW